MKQDGRTGRTRLGGGKNVMSVQPTIGPRGDGLSGGPSLFTFAGLERGEHLSSFPQVKTKL